MKRIHIKPRQEALVIVAALFALMLIIGAIAHGADINLKYGDGQNPDVILRSHKAGDHILIGAGTFTVNGPLNLASGAQLISSDGPWKAALVFKTGTNEAGIVCQGNGNLIKDLVLIANCGVIKANNLDNTTIIGNKFTWGNNGSYYNRLAIGGWGSAKNCKVKYNLFCNTAFLDSAKKPPDDRSLEIWGFSGGDNFIGNEYFDVNDGGHFMNPGDGFEHAWNVGAHIRRMGGEFQQNFWNPAVAPVNVSVHDDVYYDWQGMHWDSMILSIPLDAKAMQVYNIYGRGNETYGWNTADSSGDYRGSYGIEGPNSPDLGSVIHDCTLIGERMVEAISSPSPGLDIKNIRVYGADWKWGMFSGEPGNAGGGSINDLGGHTIVKAASRDDAKAKMQTYPQPPRLVTLKPYGQRDYVPTTQPATQPTTQPDPAPGTFATNLVTAASFNTISMAWTINGQGAVVIQRFTSNGAKDTTVSDVTLPAGSKAYTDTRFAQNQLDSKWKFFYTIAGTKGDTVQVGLNPPATQPVPPPAPEGTWLKGNPWDVWIPKAQGATTRPAA